jgi:hypothetical protein
VVGLPGERRRRGVPGGIAGRPEIATAAAGLVIGGGHPLDLLDLPRDRYLVAVAVVRAAQELKARQDHEGREQQARLIRNEIASMLKKK